MHRIYEVNPVNQAPKGPGVCNPKDCTHEQEILRISCDYRTNPFGICAHTYYFLSFSRANPSDWPSTSPFQGLVNQIPFGDLVWGNPERIAPHEHKTFQVLCDYRIKSFGFDAHSARLSPKPTFGAQHDVFRLKSGGPISGFDHPKIWVVSTTILRIVGDQAHSGPNQAFSGLISTTILRIVESRPIQAWIAP